MGVDLSDPQIRILSGVRDVEPYVESARAAADEEPSALGFLPYAAYSEAAELERLLIAVVEKDGTRSYAGHLLFGFVFPCARIFQTYVRPDFRFHGVGRKLVEALISRAEKSHFLSIKASVADDLEANKFWELMNFELVRTRQGKAERRINVRVRELATPNLLDFMRAPSKSDPADLRFLDRLSGPAPIYAIDLNVLFDVTKQRPRAKEAGQVIRAGFSNLVRLSVTEEFIHELERTSVPLPSDPILELAANLPVLLAPPAAQIQRITSALGPIIFHDKWQLNILSEQDRSDLIHLATAIHHKVAGFITSEKAILRARSQLLTNFSLDVVGVTEFAGMVEPAEAGEPSALQVTSGGATISTREIEQREDPAVELLLRTIQVPHQLAVDVLHAEPGTAKRRTLVLCDQQPVALGCWEVPSVVRPQVQADLFADEDHGAVEASVDFLLDSICRESMLRTPALIHLRMPPGQIAAVRIALTHGFRPKMEAYHRSGFQKLAIGRAIEPATWSDVATQVKRISGLGLPETMPNYGNTRQIIEIASPTDGTISIPLISLETLFSPVLFLLPGRHGAIVPIRRRFVGDLLGGNPQLSFLRPPEARLLHERVYFSSPKNESVLADGTPILFYESGREGGRACIIAAARVLRTERIAKNAIMPKHSRRGVLGTGNLQRLTRTPTLAATTFDNLFLFPHPVPLERLRQIGCFNFITARQVQSEKLIQIVREGTRQ
jgi:ribosomal protein S18 acetylase RimI-like enzyme